MAAAVLATAAVFDGKSRERIALHLDLTAACEVIRSRDLLDQDGQPLPREVRSQTELPRYRYSPVMHPHELSRPGSHRLRSALTGRRVTWSGEQHRAVTTYSLPKSQTRPPIQNHDTLGQLKYICAH